MPTIRAPKKPCAECPWRRDVPAGRFPVQKYRELARTAEDMAMSVFSCHKSSVEEPIVCAGYVLRGGAHNLALRLAYIRGDILPDSVTDGGYDLYEDYREMAVANGVAADDACLRHVR